MSAKQQNSSSLASTSSANPPAWLKKTLSAVRDVNKQIQAATAASNNSPRLGLGEKKSQKHQRSESNVSTGFQKIIFIINIFFHPQLPRRIHSRRSREQIEEKERERNFFLAIHPTISSSLKGSPFVRENLKSLFWQYNFLFATSIIPRLSQIFMKNSLDSFLLCWKKCLFRTLDFYFCNRN